MSSFIPKLIIFSAVALGLALIVEQMHSILLFLIILPLVYRGYGKIKKYSAGSSKKKEPDVSAYL